MDEEISRTGVSDVGSSTDIKFWLQDPSVLYKNFCLLPGRDKSMNQNMNCLTTVIVIVGVALLCFKVNITYTIIGTLVALLLVAFCANYFKKKKEGFARDPHHLDDDFIETNVTPLVAEEWHFDPPSYELVSDIASDGRDFTQRMYGKGYYMEPPFAPYRQYLTRTNLLPGDEAELSLFNGGVTGARTYMNDAFTRHDLAFKENMSRLYKKLNNRRYRQLGYDVISPFTSF